MSKRWHILQDAEGLTLARHLPARFDVRAVTHLPWGSPLRYAQQIRQDMWRLMQAVRGFSPVVRLRADGAGWVSIAGGRLLGRPVQAASRIQALLDDPIRRTRWITQAQRGYGAK